MYRIIMKFLLSLISKYTPDRWQYETLQSHYYMIRFSVLFLLVQFIEQVLLTKDGKNGLFLDIHDIKISINCNPEWTTRSNMSYWF